MRKLLLTIPSVFICVHLWFLSAGCSSNKKPTTKPADAYERQDAAMRDPFGYSPLGEKPDISGGGISDYDRNGMRKDVDHVLNP
jgi:hypothetical protein